MIFTNYGCLRSLVKSKYISILFPQLLIPVAEPRMHIFRHAVSVKRYRCRSGRHLPDLMPPWQQWLEDKYQACDCCKCRSNWHFVSCVEISAAACDTSYWRGISEEFALIPCLYRWATVIKIKLNANMFRNSTDAYVGMGTCNRLFTTWVWGMVSEY